jgi:hypothetical protein
VLVPRGMHHYSSGTAQAVLDHAEPDARLVFSCGWHVSVDGQDVCSLRFKAFVKAAGLLGRMTRTVDLDDQVEACRLVFESDTRWTVVRGSDLDEGESEGLPVWSRHVGDPILESNITRRIDFALFMVDTLENDELAHQAPAIVSRQSPSTLAHGEDRAGKSAPAIPVAISPARGSLTVRETSARGVGAPSTSAFPAECASPSSREAAGNRMTASSLSAGTPTRADQFAGPSARCSGVQFGSRACGQAKTSMRIPSGSKTKNA